MDILHYLYHANITLPYRINPEGKEIRGVKPLEKNSYYQYDFDDELSFLDVFDVNKSELYQENGNDIYTDYIYRGHKYSDDWKLLPSSFRKRDNEDEKGYDNRIKVYKSGNGPTSFKEVEDFSLFVKGIDAIGLNSSDASFNLINQLNARDNLNGTNTFKSSKQFSFPSDEQLGELALAQHYGVKTRLLDFTESPFTALFFASESAFPYEWLQKDNIKRIGIWVISKLSIEAISHERFIKYVDVKKFQNKYIAAQKGVFVHYFPSVNEAFELNKKMGSNSEESKFLDITYTLDQLLTSNFKNQYLNRLINEHIGKPMLFTLPHNSLMPIAKRLNQLNITWTTLMPSLDGVKKEVERQNNKPYSNMI